MTKVGGNHQFVFTPSPKISYFINFKFVTSYYIRVSTHMPKIIQSVLQGLTQQTVEIQNSLLFYCIFTRKADPKPL